eukprot:scaffold490482_cov38-Prasinocladus_malaysianus.AAC.1
MSLPGSVPPPPLLKQIVEANSLRSSGHLSDKQQEHLVENIIGCHALARSLTSLTEVVTEVIAGVGNLQGTGQIGPSEKERLVSQVLDLHGRRLRGRLVDFQAELRGDGDPNSILQLLEPATAARPTAQAPQEAQAAVPA